MNRKPDHGKRDDDEIVLSSFDSTRAMRGVFVHRRGEQPEDEDKVAKFWQSCGIEVEHLETERDLFSGMPDFRLFRDGRPFAYCEVKTIWRHTRSIRILHDEKPIDERVEVSAAPVEERLTGDLVSAVRQLQYQNADHKLFNLVVLVNRDENANPEMVAALLSSVEGLESAALPPGARRKEGLQEFRREIDLCLWASPSAGGGLIVERCFLLNPGLRSFAEEITGLRGDKLISLEPAA
jgi:hypothetical protein